MQRSAVDRSTVMSFDQNLLVVSRTDPGFSISAGCNKVPTVGMTQTFPSVSHTAYASHR